VKASKSLADATRVVSSVARQVNREASVNHLRVTALLLLAAQVIATVAVYRVVKRSEFRED
jgi:hypothetical protein